MPANSPFVEPTSIVSMNGEKACLFLFAAVFQDSYAACQVEARYPQDIVQYLVLGLHLRIPSVGMLLRPAAMRGSTRTTSTLPILYELEALALRLRSRAQLGDQHRGFGPAGGIELLQNASFRIPQGPGQRS